jgi:flagellar motor switch protein FliM
VVTTLYTPHYGDATVIGNTGKNGRKNERQPGKSMKSNEDLLAKLEARIGINREKDREDLEEMREEIKSGEAEMRSTICPFRSELEETIQQKTKGFLSYGYQKTQNLRSELTETIEKAQLELQTNEHETSRKR